MSGVFGSITTSAAPVFSSTYNDFVNVRPPSVDLNSPRSAFGPYGLSRFAAETGGRYVLWAWNPSGRARVTYEWGRCDYFPPDLRARKELLAGLASDPHASVMLRAWHLLLHEAPGLVEHLPPVDAALKVPRAVAEAPGGSSMPWTWDRVGELKEFLRGADAGLAGSARALALLDPLADVAAEPDDDRARRGLAEVRLLRHTLRTIAFELAEARTAARGVPPDAFAKMRRDTSFGCVSSELIVGKGSVLYRLSGALTRSTTPPYDEAAFTRVKAEREALVARYRGTPFAELVLFNDVSTFRVNVWTRGTPPDTSGLPAESDSPPPATPPPSGGSTGGGGPSTGR